MMSLISNVSLLLLLSIFFNAAYATTASGHAASCSAKSTAKDSPRSIVGHRRDNDVSLMRRHQSMPLAVAIPPVVQNLARGSFLKCLADLTGGLVRSLDILCYHLQLGTF